MAQDTCELLCVDLPRAEALRRDGLSPEAAETAARRAKALSDPTRLALAVALGKGGELCGCDLAWIAERPQNLVSHHLGILRRERLVHARKDGRMVMFSLSDEGSELVSAVVGERAFA